MRPRRTAGLTGCFMIVVVLGVVGCFSEHTTAPEGSDSRVPDIECSTVLPEPAADEVIVGIRSFAFHPAQVRVEPGTTVTWVNCEESGVASHTTTSDEELWDSGLLSAVGGTFSRTFQEEGVFDYHCTPHPFMRGSVVVE